MDISATGKFIARLRREHGMTQEALGEKLCVSAKTVSRWERGVYLPDLQMLELLAKTFSVTADEIIAGERRLTNEHITNVENACESPIRVETASSDSAFTLSDRIAYFKRKWIRDNALSLAVSALLLVAALVCGLIFDIYLLGLAAIIAGFCIYLYERNDMMSYVEMRAFRENVEGVGKDERRK